MLDGSKGTAGICFHMVAFGNEDGQFTEGAIGFNGAIFGNFFTAAEVDGQLTKAQIDVSFGQPGQRDQKELIAEAGVTLELFIIQIAAAGGAFCVAVVTKVDPGGMRLFYGICQ